MSPTGTAEAERAEPIAPAPEAPAGPPASPSRRLGASLPPLRRLLRLARAEWRGYAVGTLFLILSAVMTLAVPQFVRAAIDEVTGAVRHPGRVERLALYMVACIAVDGLAVFLREYFFRRSGERLAALLRRRVFENVMVQEMSFFDTRRTGDLVSRLSVDAATLEGALGSELKALARDVLYVVLGIGLLVATSPALTGIALLVVPVVALAIVRTGRSVKRLSRETQDAVARCNEIAAESIAGIRTVRLFSDEERTWKRYGEAIGRALTLSTTRIRATTLGMGLSAFLAESTTPVIVFFGVRMVASGSMTTGALVSFAIYGEMLASAAKNVIGEVAELVRAAGATERLFALLDRAPSMAIAEGATLPQVQGEIRLEAVRFAYPARRDAPVLQDIDLAVKKGEVVALVGPSGGGKSTIAALITRLHDPDGGRVSLDGHDLRGLDARWLRRQIGVVEQEPILFATTIADNIRLGRESAGLDEVMAAARTAHADRFIRAFPEGYDTLVGERGVQLSGGQKQRIAIARAVLKDPPVLILDEATSSLDAESEQLVHEAMERLMRERTTVLIAHRLSTVMAADRILVIQGGRIVESGRHAELLQANGLYRQLVEGQVIQG